MMRFGLLLLIGTLVLPLSRMSAENPGPGLTDRALQVKINPDGFKTISSGVSNLILRDVSNVPLPDIDEDVGFGIQAKLTEMRYSLKFKDFQLAAGPGNMVAEVIFDEIRVDVPKARFTKNVGTTLKTTCKNTVLTAGHNSTVKLHITLVPRVENGRIVLDPTAVSFPLPAEEFTVNGPESCSGDFGVGQVIKLALNKALTMARGRIASAVETKVRDATPEIARQLNEVITQEVPLSVGQGIGAPIKNLILSATPYQVSVTSSEALFSMSVSVREGLITQKTRKSVDIVDQNLDVSLGAFGIRTAFVNEMIATAMPVLPAALEIDTNSSSVLREIFSRQGLGAILPDISDVPMDSEIVKARIGFGRAPEITTTRAPDGGAVLSLNISDMRIFIDIVQGGVRVPYFEMVFGTAANVRLDIVSGQLTLNLEQPSGVTVDGQWAPGYTPATPIFERDVARTIFFTALDILCQGGILARVDVPELKLSPNETVTIGNPRADYDFIEVDLLRR